MAPYMGLLTRILSNSPAYIIEGAKEVCYGDLGCFKTDGEFIDMLKRPCSVIPTSPQSISTTFFLNRRSRDPAYLKYNDEDSVKKSGFDPNIPTKIIIHGFLDDGSKNWIKVIYVSF